jgi:hypothetical protein
MAEQHGTYTHDFWQNTLPRAFHNVPATRHFMVAFGMLESCLGLSDQSVINARCKLVQYHHAMAVRSLTTPDVQAADLAMAPFLGWLLAMFTMRSHEASLHAKALERFATMRCVKDHNDLETHGLEHALATVARNRHFKHFHQFEMTVLQAVEIRSHMFGKSTTEEILQASEVFARSIDPKTMTPAQFQAAIAFLDLQVLAVQSNAYSMGMEAPLKLLGTLLSVALLWKYILHHAAETSNAAEARSTEESLCHLLDHFESIFEDSIATTCQKKSDQSLLDAANRLAFCVMDEHTPLIWRRRHQHTINRSLLVVSERLCHRATGNQTGGQDYRHGLFHQALDQFLQQGRTSNVPT